MSDPDQKWIAEWLQAKVIAFAIQGSLARQVLAEAGDSVDVESLADHLDGVGHPELADQIVEDYTNRESIQGG